MHLNNLSNERSHSTNYDEFMLWFKNNYPHFFDSYIDFLSDSGDPTTPVKIDDSVSLTEEEQQFLLSVIELYKSQGK